MEIPVISRVLDRALASRPAAPAVVARSGVLTFAELDAAADAAAGALWELGVRPGDRVAACLPNDLEIVAAFHGAQRIGAIWAGIGEALTAAEQQALADLCRPAVILAGPRCTLEGGTVVDAGRWARLTAARPAAPAVTIDPHAPAGIAFSSGTTGTPKAVVHSQHSLVLPAAALVATRGWGPDLRKGDCFPFTILNLQVLSTLVTAQAGGCSIVMDRRDPEGVADWIRRERVTVWNGAPAQLFDLARRADLDLNPLAEVWTGGGPCPEAVRDAFRAAHDLPVTATYGLSEAPTVVAIDPVGGAHRDGASGRVLPHLTVTAYDGEGRRLPPGQSGELGISATADGAWAGCWRGPLGYWQGGGEGGWSVLRPAEPGIVMTGDVGSVDEDGWLTMVDRKKLMIVRGGANVSPAEVEAVLTQHPLVAAAVVFGVPDDRLGERVAALVVPEARGSGTVPEARGSGTVPEARGSGTAAADADTHADAGLDAASLAEFCSGHLARYKIPEIWRRSGPLPTNAMGKIIRTGLVDRLGSCAPL
jgi:long-chain acyl-CoA synthetase